MIYFIENNIGESRFELSVEGYTAFVEYSVEGNTITFIHTEVPYPLKGKGIASSLGNYVLEFAKENNFKVIPYCPFIKSYILRHEEYKPLVKRGFLK
jgi:uncharacterized protein